MVPADKEPPVRMKEDESSRIDGSFNALRGSFMMWVEELAVLELSLRMRMAAIGNSFTRFRERAHLLPAKIASRQSLPRLPHRMPVQLHLILSIEISLASA